MNLCECGNTLNTGAPNKQRVIATGSKLFLAAMKADDGVANAIANTDDISQAFLDALINNEDKTKRWYPIGEFKSGEDVRADALSESFTDGSNAITNQGIRTYLGWLIDYAPKYIEQLRSFGCGEFGVYVLDPCGNLTGSVSKDGLSLRPIRVNAASWNPTLIKASPTAVGKVQLAFEFSQLEKDEYLRSILDSEIDADLQDAEGLLALEAVISAEATTGFVAALTVLYDIFLASSKTKAIGWTITDFVVFNVTTNLAVVVTSVTEAPEGTYTFVLPIQASADVLRLTNDKTSGNKPGFFVEQLVTVP